MENKLPSQEVQDALKCLFDHFDREDRPLRERKLRLYRQLKFYWAGFLRIWFDEVAHDWRVMDSAIEDPDDQNEYYDKPINVFRAYLESIIAALSVTTPKPLCYPADADNPLDITTARAGTKIGEKIFRDNDGDLLWIHALFIYCTEGLISAYHYPKEDAEYGTYKEDIEETRNMEKYVCPNCGNETTQIQLLCPECGEEMDPMMEPQPFEYTVVTGHKEIPKVKQCVEVYGGTFIKTPVYARKQKDMPYLFWYYETHYSNVMERYPHLRKNKKQQLDLRSMGAYDDYEAYARLAPEYYGELPDNTLTMRNGWFRPCSYYTLDEEQCDLLKREFPDGVKIVFANSLLAEAYGEKLDDRWTLTHNPLSDTLNYDPIGLLLVSVQDIMNDLISLTLQTVEHGIPESFADPTVLDFDAYRQKEVMPGGISPAKPQPGRQLGEGFHTIKTTTLGTEVLPFGEQVQALGQLASGALPSLFGGSSKAGSETAAEYSMSRAQALQRLQTVWKMLCKWWKDIYGKTIPSYIEDMMEDEQYVERTNEGGFVNVFIRRAELEGRIGRYELDIDDQLPMSWQQKRDIIMQLMNASNPVLMGAIMAPENLPFIKEALGLHQFTMPGEADRNKQYDEIHIMVDSAPILVPPSPEMTMMAQMGAAVPPEELQDKETSSVEIEPDVDNHEIHAQICKAWLVSDAGRGAKIDKPLGYRNVLLHLKDHMDQLAMAMMQGQMQQPGMEGQSANGNKPPNPQGNNQSSFKDKSNQYATGDQDARQNNPNVGPIQ